MKNHSRFISCTIVAIFGLMMFIGASFDAQRVHAAEDSSVVDQINITVPVSCAMSGVGMNTHNATIPNGQHESAIGETTIKAFCNDTEGFSIYAVGYTDETVGKNVLTDASLGDEYDIVTGTATSGESSNWAMKVGKITSPTPTYPLIIAGSTEDSLKEPGGLDYSAFQDVPNDYTRVAYRLSATDVNPTGQDIAEGATMTTTYQVYISNTQAAGTYSGQVKYTLVHPYNEAKPEKPLASCIQSVPGVTYMQDITAENLSTVLSSMNEDHQYYLRDKRDNQPYCVAKLKDGKLWMTEDLNLAGGTSLSSMDTDFEATYELPTTNGLKASGDKIVLPDSAVKNDTNNSLTDTNQFRYDNYAYVFNSGVKEDCGGSGQNAPCHSYYSWDAATLGSGRTLNQENNDALYSICPKGWKLPTTGNSTNEEWKRGSLYPLAINYGASLESSVEDSSSTTGANFFNNAGPGTAANFLLSGFYMNGSLRNGGGYGLYWSASSYSSTAMARSLALSSSFVSVSNYANRRSGFSVRCMVR